YDSTKMESATTFFNYNNCTNYGAQLMFSIPSTSCSSGATGTSSGQFGLLYSAALKANLTAPGDGPTAGDPDGNRRLTAEEIRQISIATIDNFYNPADA